MRVDVMQGYVDGCRKWERNIQRQMKQWWMRWKKEWRRFTPNVMSVRKHLKIESDSNLIFPPLTTPHSRHVHLKRNVIHSFHPTYAKYAHGWTYRQSWSNITKEKRREGDSIVRDRMKGKGGEDSCYRSSMINAVDQTLYESRTILELPNNSCLNLNSFRTSLYGQCPLLICSYLYKVIRACDNLSSHLDWLKSGTLSTISSRLDTILVFIYQLGKSNETKRNAPWDNRSRKCSMMRGGLDVLICLDWPNLLIYVSPLLLMMLPCGRCRRRWRWCHLVNC